MPSLVNPPIIVCGVSRGGTSMVAGLLRVMGVNMGENIGDLNHEDLDVISKTGSDFVEYITLRSQQSLSEKWGFKYPHLHDFYQQCIDILSQCKLIFIFRDHFSVALSYKKYHNIPLSAGVREATKRYARLSSMFCELESSALPLSYEKAIHNKAKCIKDIADYVGIELSEQKQRECIAFISPGAYKRL